MSLPRALLVLCALAACPAIAEEAAIPPSGEKAQPQPTLEGPAEEPVVVPKHPLADTSRAAEEKARLQPDPDAALDRELGIAPRQGAAVDDTSGLGWQLVKTLFTLALVVALIYLSLNYGLRKLMGLKSGPLGGKGGVVQVVERIPIEQRRTLFVLKAAGEYLLIGASEGGMSLLSKLDPAEVERIQREQGAAAMQLSPFFQKLLTKRGGPPPQA